MLVHGFDKFTISKLSTVTIEELDQTEINFIKQLNTLAPNGYNLTTGGERFDHTDETKNRISTKIKEHMLSNIDKYRQLEETKGMPLYCAYKNINGYEAYYVNNHPLCNKKYFSVFKYGSKQAARDACEQFLIELNSTGTYTRTGTIKTPVKCLRNTDIKLGKLSKAEPLRNISMIKVFPRMKI